MELTGTNAVATKERELESVFSRLVEQNARLSGVLDRMEGVVGRLDGGNSVGPDTAESPVSGLLSRIVAAQDDGASYLNQINDVIDRLERIA